MPPLKNDALLTQGSLLAAMARYRDAVAPLLQFLQAVPRGDAAVRTGPTWRCAAARCERLDEANGCMRKSEEKSSAGVDSGDHRSTVGSGAGRRRSGLGCDPVRPFGQSRYLAGEKLKGLSGQAWSQFKAGHRAEAEQLFAQLLNEHPADAMASEAALARGQILEQLGRADPALAMYDMVIRRYAKTEQYPQALLAAARGHHKLQQYSQAVENYERLAKDFPSCRGSTRFFTSGHGP